jgi:hypothetical protein
MNIQTLICFVACAFLPLSLSGCTSLSVPQNGSGTVKIIEGGLVETMVFDGRVTLNIQITKEHKPKYEHPVQHVLTIGKFSPIIGSGFTKRSNIYYESKIGLHGQDTFEVDRKKYHVLWREVDVIPGPKHSVTSVFSVTIEQAHL